MGNWFLLLIGGVGLGLGAFFVARSPMFWINLVKQVFMALLPSFLKLFQNRPKTPAEWAEQRYLKSIKSSDLSASQRTRLKEINKLNREFKK